MRRTRHNPRAPRELKRPFVVLVRRFDPTGEELTRWEPLVRDADGRPEFFSEAKAKAAAKKPPRDADLHVGDIIAAVPVEAVSDIDNHATALCVVTPDGVMESPRPPEELGGPWLARWGQDARDMLGWSALVDGRRIAMAACDCAEAVLHLVPTSERRPRRAIEAARAYSAGRTSHGNVSAARKAVGDFRAISESAGSAAAVSAAQSAEYEGTAAAAAAESAVAYAAYAANEANGTPYEATYQALAPLVERWIPLPVILLSVLGYPSAIPLNLDGVQSTQTQRSDRRRRSGRTTRGRR